MKVCTDACILGALAKHPKPFRILDIGAGTGLLSLMAAQRYICPIDAVEVQEQAFEIANENITNSPWDNRVQVFCSPIQEFSSDHQYDLIISNPPFFYRHKTPVDEARKLALHNSSLPYSDIVQSVLKYLSRDGKFYILLPPAESATFSRMMFLAGFRMRLTYRIRNSNGKPVFRIISAYSYAVGEYTEIDFTIATKDGGYSAEFVEALRPYYLNL